MVISKKLLSILDSVKYFKRDVISVIIFDFLEKDPFIDNKLRENIKKTLDYVYLKLFQFVLIDKTVMNSFNKNIKYKSDFNLVEPDEGFNPIFCVKQLPGRVFINEEAFKTINEYNVKSEDKIKGIKLYDGYDYISY